MLKNMGNKFVFGIGVFVAIGVAYAIYKFLKKSKSESDGESPYSSKKTCVTVVDYEMLYNWLKAEYKRPDLNVCNGYKFGIMPSDLAKQTYKEEFNEEIHLTDSNDVLCVFIIDDKEENVISNHYFVYKEMSQSLKDMLHSNKVYIQELKK